MSSLIYKRAGSANYYVSGSRVSTRTSDRPLALEFARKHIAESYRTGVLGSAVVRTWSELVNAWTVTKADKRSLDRDLSVIHDPALAFDRNLPVAAITSDLVRNYGLVVKDRASASTADRHLSVIKAMLNFAFKSAWIEAVPHIELYRPAKTEAKWLTAEQFALILPHLDQYVADFMTIAIKTGLRFSNVLGLRWNWIVDGRVTIPASESKSGKQFSVKLPTAVLEIADRLRATANSDFVLQQETYFHYRSKWNHAVAKAGLPATKMHALRHSYATQKIQDGVPIYAVSKLLGHSSVKVTEQFYCHASDDYLDQFIN